MKYKLRYKTKNRTKAHVLGADKTSNQLPTHIQNCVSYHEPKSVRNLCKGIKYITQ